MIFKIAIVEDDQTARENIVKLLTRYAAEHGLEFAYFQFENGFLFLNDFKTGEYDIIFMDIYMPGLNGLDVSKEMREKDKDAVLVFVTDLAQYAIKGYEVDAYDFVVKPVSYEHLEIKLDRLIPTLQRRKAQKPIVFSKSLKGGGHVVALEPNNIKYIEIIAHDTIIHTVGEDVHVNMSLSDIEKILPESFYRCNHCYIVNMKFVSTVKKYVCKMATGEELTVSRPRKKGFVDALMNYLGGQE